MALPATWPTGPGVLTMARSFVSARSDPLAFLQHLVTRYGDRVSLPVPDVPTLLLSGPADVQALLRASPERWTTDTVQYQALERVTGPGLLASSGPGWMERRRMVAPVFHHRRLAAVGQGVRGAAAEPLAALAAGLPRTGAVVDVAPVLRGIALDAVGRALFRTDLSAGADPDAAVLLRATSSAAEYIVRAGRTVVPGARRLPTPTNRALDSARRRLDGAVARMVRRRLAERAGSGDHGDDLLGILLDAGLDPAAVRDELITMVVAGHETVATALSWTVALLAEHPGVQEEVRAELAASPPELTTPADRVPVTRSVIDESLRLYPPAWALSRRAAGPETVGTLDVPEGTMAIVSPWVVHRRADLWDEPTRFRPERFRGSAPRPVPGSYLPFGSGPRLCVGREFALGEMLLVLDELLARVHVDAPPGWRRPRAEARVAVHPAGGVSVRLTP